MHDATITLSLRDADIAGWFDLVGERISADGCQRERWTFQSTYSAFLVVELTAYVAETRPSRRHRTWEGTTTWPRRAGGLPPALPAGMVEQVAAAARDRIVVHVPGQPPYPSGPLGTHPTPVAGD